MDNTSRPLRVSSLDGRPATATNSPTSLQTSPAPGHEAEEPFVPGYPPNPLPPPGSQEEDRIFRYLYDQLAPIWRSLMQEKQLDETVVVVPSFSLDPEELLKIGGIEFYEERLLFLLILLRNPRTHIVYVTSLPIRDRIVDYYLQLLPGVPYSHARARLHLYSTDDASRDKSLTQKILERPALLKRIRNCARMTPISHLTVFNVTHLEKTLSVALGLPLMGADPRHLPIGTKSGCRKLFRETGVLFPDGFEDLKNIRDIATATVDLYIRHANLKRVVIKINEGFSGEGNAIYRIDALRALGNPLPLDCRNRAIQLVIDTLPTQCKMQAPHLPWAEFLRKFEQMEGVVEEFLEGVQKESPSVQTRLTPLGEAQVISTHDQIMGGDDGQVFLGCRFPAAAPFLKDLHAGGKRISQHLVSSGLIERVSIDYLAVPANPEHPVSPSNPWKLYAIEINLRKGGTTHPFRTLQFMTGGFYDPDACRFTTPNGESKFYVASDNLVSEKYRGLLPEDLIDLTTYAGLHYNSTTNTGVIFHMIGAISQYGKLGITCIANSPEEAQALYDKTIRTLDLECGTTNWML